MAELVNALWEEPPPASPEKAIQSYVARLRAAVRDRELVVTRQPGYVLDVPAEAIDAARFSRLVGEGQRAHGVRAYRTAVRHLDAALELWRGEPYGEFADAPFAQWELARLTELRMAAIETKAAAELAQSDAMPNVAELEWLVGQYPTRERLWVLLLEALRRAGRRADALAVYRRARHALIEQVGIEPGEELRAVHAQLLKPGVVTAPTVSSISDLVLPPATNAFVAGDLGVDSVLHAAEAALGAVRRTLRSPSVVASATESSSVPAVLEPLVSARGVRRPAADIAVLQQAYDVAQTHHAGALRKSGDPYITHPMAVAAILSQHSLDATTLTTALLHDTIEDTDYSLAELKRDFGADVAALVAAVTAVSGIDVDHGADSAIHSFDRVTGDPRVLLVKLADRLHNLRTIQYLPEDVAVRVARTTLDVLLPLAQRFGVNFLRREMEDEAFAVLDPSNHHRIRTWIRETARDGRRKVAAEQLAVDLRETLPAAAVVAPPDGCYALWVQGDPDPPVFVRVVVHSPLEVHATVGLIAEGRRTARVIHQTPSTRVRIVVTDAVGLPLEIEVTTIRPHLRAEYGAAAQWISPQSPTVASYNELL
jgi:DNA-binding SARP family transcriptional activator